MGVSIKGYAHDISDKFLEGFDARELQVALDILLFNTKVVITAKFINRGNSCDVRFFFWDALIAGIDGAPVPFYRKNGLWEVNKMCREALKFINDGHLEKAVTGTSVVNDTIERYERTRLVLKTVD